jgi:hypothetical protein
MQWILFAKQPLDTEELRHALAFSTDDPPPSIASWSMTSEYLEEGQRFEYLLVNRSLGLLEVLAAARITNALNDPSVPVDRESRRRVQFIDESVRDFLLRSDAPGLNLLRPTLGIHYAGESHDKLLRGCISYIATEEVRKLSAEIQNCLDALFRTPHIDKTGGLKLPFLPYAIKHLLKHAFEADHDGAAQINLPNRSLEVNIQTLRAWYRPAQEDDDQVRELDRVDVKAVLLRELFILLRRPLILLILLISRAQSRFWAPLRLDAHTMLYRCLSSRMWKVYTTISEGTGLGT